RPRPRAPWVEQRVPRRDLPRARAEIQRRIPAGEHAQREALRTAGRSAVRHLQLALEAAVPGAAPADHPHDLAHRQHQALRDGQGGPDDVRAELRGAGRRQGGLRGEQGRLAAAGVRRVPPRARVAQAPAEAVSPHGRHLEPHEALSGVPDLGLAGVRGVLPAGRHGAEVGRASAGDERPRESEPRLFAGRLHRAHGLAPGLRGARDPAAAGGQRRDARAERQGVVRGLAEGHQAGTERGREGCPRQAHTGDGTQVPRGTRDRRGGVVRTHPRPSPPAGRAQCCRPPASRRPCCTRAASALLFVGVVAVAAVVVAVPSHPRARRGTSSGRLGRAAGGRKDRCFLLRLLLLSA
ncbi:unnamed protein product, partial [Prorocentrum cordatum]